MPMSPSEILNKQRSDSSDEVARIIRDIENYLAERFTGASVWIAIPDVHHGHNAAVVLALVKAAFEAKGWSVAFRSDQRDGDAWEFSAGGTYQVKGERR